MASIVNRNSDHTNYGQEPLPSAAEKPETSVRLGVRGPDAGGRHSADRPPPTYESLDRIPEGQGASQAAAPLQHGQYGLIICHSPSHSRHSPPTSESGGSMDKHLENATPPGSPRSSGSPGAVTATQIERLSLEHDPTRDCLPFEYAQSHSDHRAILKATPHIASKRPASSELPRPPGRQSPAYRGLHGVQSSGPRSSRGSPRVQRGVSFGHRRNVQRGPSTAAQQSVMHSQRVKPLTPGVVHPPLNPGSFPPAPRDSGYESIISAPKFWGEKAPDLVCAARQPEWSNPRKDNGVEPRNQGPKAGQNRYTGLTLQLDASPMSIEHLTAEAKGIYHQLVMVESKCMNFDAAQMKSSDLVLGPEEWKALIDIHRTLLYEHHDFLMATQHPAATPALRNLAVRYGMPARLWKHGIHAFLEVLRYRCPTCPDYLVAFLCLAYQMMALLYETVPAFTNVWVECLGDIARYRMAVEHDKEAHATWGGVAARWYLIASERNPAVGRLNHHLGILERSGLRKLFLYAKSQTCVIPFPNARGSLTTFYESVVGGNSLRPHGGRSFEELVVTFHAHVFLRSEAAVLEGVFSRTREALQHLPVSRLRDLGVLLMVSNVALLFEQGDPRNLLWRLYSAAVNQTHQGSRSSEAAPGDQASNNAASGVPTFPSSIAQAFCYGCFNSLLRPQGDRQSHDDVLPAVHIFLVWLHSLQMLQSRLNDAGQRTNITDSFLLGSDRVSWSGLCTFLNSHAQHHPIQARLIEYARQGIFPSPAMRGDVSPLPEDFQVRGLVWAGFYFPAAWFEGHSEEDCRGDANRDDLSTARAERVQWLALCLAFRSGFVVYDAAHKKFRIPSDPMADSAVVMPQTSLPAGSNSGSDDFEMVNKFDADQRYGPVETFADAPASTMKHPTLLPTHDRQPPAINVRQSPQSITHAPQKKRALDYSTVKVFDEEEPEFVI